MTENAENETIAIDGYGASIEYDGITVRLKGGKTQAGIWRTGSVVIPVSDITDITYRSASALVNGSIRFRTARPANEYATPREDGAQTTVTENGLGIHWRKKDQAAFDRLRVALERATTKNAPADS